MFKQLLALVEKDIRIEWRTQRIINEILLYLGIVIFICYFSFNLYSQNIQVITWNIFFWLILVFSSTTIVDKTFREEYERKHLFYYSLLNPSVLILSKIVLNTLFLLLVFLMALCLYSLIMGNYVGSWGLFSIILFLSSLAFSSILTLVASIAAQTTNPATLTVILGFPLLLPVLLMGLKMSSHVIDNLPFHLLYDELGILIALIAIALTISIVFFPYIWRK